MERAYDDCGKWWLWWWYQSKSRKLVDTSTTNIHLNTHTQYPDMGHFAHYGFSTISTDTGHLSASPDGSWALNNPESIIDWGYRSIHGSVALSKQIITAYYASDIQFSYYAGCSTGGRQGLKEMQLHPDSFDGILAGAPAWYTTHQQPWTTWLPLQNYPINSTGYIPSALTQNISHLINAQCDPQDGLADNVMENPFACKIDYGAVAASLGLNRAQLTTLQRLYEPWIADDGTLIFPAHTPGTVLSLADPTNPNPLGYTYFNYFLRNEPNYTIEDFLRNGPENELLLADEMDPGSANADDYAAIKEFRDRGGKLLMYHGLFDPAIPTKSSVLYWNKTVEALGGNASWTDTDGEDGGAGSSVDEFFRLFLVPNMGHCSGSTPAGSNAPWYFAAASQNPGPATSGFQSGVPGCAAGGSAAQCDAVKALMAWVENGQAPDSLVVTKFWGDNTTDVVRRGVVCKWPETAVWVGGERERDLTSTEGWECQG
jgi:feruloyl esterase